MDPLSATASVVAVIGTARQTYKALLALYSLKKASKEILELANEVSELQALLSLVEKAIESVPLSTILPDDQVLIKRLVESAKAPLDQLNNLIASCAQETDRDTAAGRARLSISLTKWLKSRDSIDKVRQKVLRAHCNISTALISLNHMHRQDDNRLLLNIYKLLLDQTDRLEKPSDAIKDEAMIYPRFDCALAEHKGETTPRNDTSSIIRTIPPVSNPSDKLEVSRHDESVRMTWLASEQEALVLNNDDEKCDYVKAFAGMHIMSSRRGCLQNCRCQCHCREGDEGLLWANTFLGTLFCKFKIRPLFRPDPCNYARCIQQEAASCQITYHFPQWMMKRAFMVTASYANLSGRSMSWGIDVPHAISASHKAWQFIETSQFGALQQLLRERLISSNDMADDDGVSLLFYALKFRRHEIVKLLLDYGANPHFVDPRGISAYAYAQSNLLIDRLNQVPVWAAKMNLTTCEPSVTDDLGFTPLHYIVTGLKKADLRQQLSISAVSIDAADCFGLSLLHWAVITGNSTAVEALLEYGALVNCVDRERMTPLHHIYLTPPSRQLRCGRILLNAGAKTDARDFWSRTPLRIAVGYSSTSLELIELLLSNGSNVNCKDMYSQSPLLKSIQGRSEVTQLLLDHGADITACDDYGNTLLLEAVYRDKPQHLRLLLERGANDREEVELKPGRRARDGNIHLLDFVAWYGSVETMHILADFSAQQQYFYRPLDTPETYRSFRLAHGRKAGLEEHEAFLSLLSRRGLCVATCRTSDFVDGEDVDREIFVDAHDTVPEEMNSNA